MDRLPETERSLGFPLATSRRMPEKPGREAAARARAKMVSTTPTGYFISERAVMEKRLAEGTPRRAAAERKSWMFSRCSILILEALWMRGTAPGWMRLATAHSTTP